MFNNSQFIKFLWVDDYYMTGLLPYSVNATYHPINDFYSLKIETDIAAFLGRNSTNPIFGHLYKSFGSKKSGKIRDKRIDKMYQIWKHIYRTEMSDFSTLKNTDEEKLLSSFYFN